MRGWRTITSVVRTPCVSCSSLAAALCVLRMSYTSQKTQANRKENEHVENSLRQPCDLVFRTAVLRCSILHREAAARNPETCQSGQVHGCRKADVTQALYMSILSYDWHESKKVCKDQELKQPEPNSSPQNQNVK